MSYAFTVTAPPYIIHPHAYNGPLVVAAKQNLPSERHYDVVQVSFHLGRLKWFFQHETGGPIQGGKDDLRFMSLDEALTLFTESTGLQVPEFMVVQGAREGCQVYRDGKFEHVDGANPTDFEPGRKYFLPVKPRPLQVASPLREYVGIASADGFGRLVRDMSSDSAIDALEFVHLTDEQKHRVVRTNLGLPLNPTHSDRDGSVEPETNDLELHFEIQKSSVQRPRF